MAKILFKYALQYVTEKLKTSNDKLTPSILKEKGWTTEAKNGKIYWVEKNIKTRDKVWIHFEGHWYTVFHGRDITFIALQTSVEWLELYLFLRSPNVKFDNPEDILKGEGI